MPSLLEGIQKGTDQGKEEKNNLKELGDSLKEGLIIQGFAELSAEAAKLSALAPRKIERVGFYEESDKTQFVQKVSRFLEAQQDRDRPNEEFLTVQLLDLAVRALGEKALYQKFGQHVFDVLNDLLKVEKDEKSELEEQRAEEHRNDEMPLPPLEKSADILQEGLAGINRKDVSHIKDRTDFVRAVDSLKIRESKSRYDTSVLFSDSDRELLDNLTNIQKKLSNAYSRSTKTERALDENNDRIEKILDVIEDLSNLSQEEKNALSQKNADENAKKVQEIQEEKRKKEAVDHLEAEKIKQSLGNT